MLIVLTILIIAAVGYAFFVEGLFTAFVMFCNVFAAGLVAFNFWEPIAEAIGGLGGYEDSLVLVLLFSLTLGLLRLTTHNIATNLIEFNFLMDKIGGALFGLATGYLISGFLACVFQTLPWHEKFMQFDYEVKPNEGMRRIFPADRMWLALMRRAGAEPFATDEGKTFDPFGTFELRYARYRRYADDREPLSYQGEFENEIHPRLKR